MVNLSDFEKQFYTPAELKKIELDIAEMEKREAQKAREDAEYAERPLQSSRKPLYEAYLAEDKDQLAMIKESITTFVRCRERFHGNGTIDALCMFLVTYYQHELTATIGDIANDRREIQAAG